MSIIARDLNGQPLEVGQPVYFGYDPCHVVQIVEGDGDITVVVSGYDPQLMGGSFWCEDCHGSWTGGEVDGAPVFRVQDLEAQ